MKTIRLLERAARLWQRSGRHPDWLDHRGDRLLAAEALAERSDFARRLSGLLADYLAACRQITSSDARRRRRLAGIAFVHPAQEALAANRSDRALIYAIASAIVADDPDFEIIPELAGLAMRAVTESRLHARLAHEAAVTDAQLSCDGRLVATGSVNGIAIVWDVASGTELARLRGHPRRRRRSAYLGGRRRPAGPLP
jgi:hypothetical protein